MTAVDMVRCGSCDGFGYTFQRVPFSVANRWCGGSVTDGDARCVWKVLPCGDSHWPNLGPSVSGPWFAELGVCSAVEAVVFVLECSFGVSWQVPAQS
jgi:hypothetical protein